MAWTTLDNENSSSDIDDESIYSFIPYFMTDSEHEADFLIDWEEKNSNATDLAMESHMNAAGRSTTHPFCDLRSAARARHQSRKGRSNSAGKCRSVACRKWGQRTQRAENKRRKREIVRLEVVYSRERKNEYFLHYDAADAKPISSMWEVSLEEELDEEMERARRETGELESGEVYTDLGELFSVWAQRRIAEIRAVKESRLRKSEPATQRVAISQTKRLHRSSRDEYNLYHGSVHSTTLPTNSYDAYGHAILRAVLTPSPWAQQHARFSPAVCLLPRINGFAWFSEYAWQWHMDASQCWTTEAWDDRCDCCERLEHEAALAEIMQCGLLNWIDAEGWRLIVNEELEREREAGRGDGESEVGSVCGSEWSVVDGGSEEDVSVAMHMSCSSSSSDLVVVEW
jgi:hypothetical protein